VRSEANVVRAIEYAIQDRFRADWYFEYFEMEYVLQNRPVILREIVDELGDISTYHPRAAYAYFPPKTDLCRRRMIYLRFKDLAIRYAIVGVFADHLDDRLLSRCFANRRATGQRTRKRLLDDFAEVSWPRFCAWQRNCAERYDVLVKTDISAFYDSVSHDYLVEAVASELSVPPSSELMELFKRVLRVPVFSYSQLTGTVVGPHVMKQGLPIGNTTEGFLANLYLKCVDDSMLDTVVEFGRYNDDMRLFASTRKEALDALLVLQQQLLPLCLNLNSGKTDIAEGHPDIQGLRSKDGDVYEYLPIFDLAQDEAATSGLLGGAGEVRSRLDRPLDEPVEPFAEDDELSKPEHAKKLCKHLSFCEEPGNLTLQVADRAEWHVDRLLKVLVRFKGSSRHASWLLVQTACFHGVPDRAQCRARDGLLSALRSAEIAAYAKYRMLHHLVKFRKHHDGSEFRMIDDLPRGWLVDLGDLMPVLARARAFELAITALYVLRVLGASPDEIRRLVADMGPGVNQGPIAEALSYMVEPELVAVGVSVATADEPDGVEAPS